jgi:hypothetical protein
MKHIYEFENFLNEAASQVNLQDVKSQIKVYGKSRKIEWVGKEWKDLPASSTNVTEIKGVTFSVLGPNKIQCVFPSVQLMKNCRFYLILKIPGVKDIYLYKFGKPTDRNAKINQEVVGLNEPPDYGPSQDIGKKTTWTLENKAIAGNKLTIVIDATKAKYWNG